MRHDDDVRQRVGHLEIEVGDLKAGQARLEVSSMSISADVQTIVAKLNQPPPPSNLINWISVVIVALTVIASFAWTTLQPITSDIADLERSQKDHAKETLLSAYKSGRTDQKIEDNSDELTTLQKSLEAARLEISELKQYTAEGKVSRKAIGDYLKELSAEVKSNAPSS